MKEIERRYQAKLTVSEEWTTVDKDLYDDFKKYNTVDARIIATYVLDEGSGDVDSKVVDDLKIGKIMVHLDNFLYWHQALEEVDDGELNDIIYYKNQKREQIKAIMEALK